MQKQLDNKLISSFLLMVDHEVQKRGLAYSNGSGQFYPIANPNPSLTAYASPFKQLCNDTSISGAAVMSGVYLNNNFVTVGQSGLASINHYQGVVYFNTGLPNGTFVSGNYAVKEFNVEFVDQLEWKLLFETQYQRNGTNLSGLALDQKTAPAIFVRMKNQDNRPFAIGGLDDSQIRLRAIVIADNDFQRVGVCNILKNMNYRPLRIPLTLPFNSVGNMTGVNYNYDQLSFDDTFQPWILSVKVIDIPFQGSYKDLVRNVAMVDFEITTIVRHTY